MEFFEKDLEEIIYLSDKEDLSDRGLNLRGILKRQLRIGNYGIADLIEFKRPYFHSFYGGILKGEINIIELKNKKIGVSTFFQALNYAKVVHTFLDKIKYNSSYYNIRITLIGREFDNNSSFCYLGDVFNNDLSETDIHEDSKVCVDLYTYSYSIKGIKFNEISGYNLTNKGF
jgi:hypothetical protein